MKELDIAKAMQVGTIPPQQAVELRVQLAGLYAFYSQELEDILMRKPAVWITIRVKHKSDTQAEREWSATPDGLNEVGLGMRLKRISTMMSSLKSIIDTQVIDYHHTK